jgi:ABC-type phosphate/phosphonate transport system ATPase subunit
MEVTIVGLQNAGKTSLLRVLAVSDSIASSLSLVEGVMGMQNCPG